MLSRSAKNFTMSLLAFALIGCGLKLGEENKPAELAEVKTAQCLNKAIAEMKVFFRGDATDEQVETSVLCLQNVFVAFKENIRGESKDVYTAKEITTFVELNFLKDGDSKFTDSFLTELMFFKVALFGGNEDFIHKNEINLIVNFLARFKSDLVHLNPYMKVLTGNWKGHLVTLDETAKERHFSAAKIQFSSFIKKLSLEFADGHREYKIDHLLNFLIEVLKFSKSDVSAIKTVQKAGPFLKKFKYYLIGGSDGLKEDDWQKLGLTMNEAYFQTLRFEYFLKDLDSNQLEKKWSVYEKVATDLTGLIENLLQTRRTQQLTNHEIFELLQPLKEFLPQVDISEELLDQLGDVKIMILGHSPAGRKGWSRSDFAALQTKIPLIFKNVVILLETIDYLSPNKSISFRRQTNYLEFEKAEIKILAAISSLSDLIEKPYDLESGRLLVKNLANGPLKNNIKLPENFDSLFNVAVAAKKVLTGNSGTILSTADVKLVMNVGIRAYLNYLEYDLFSDPFNFNSVPFMQSLERLWPKMKITLATELNLKSEHVLKTSDLTQLILVLQDEKILKTKISAVSLDAVFNALWSHILNSPEERLQSIIRQGFDLISLAQISQEVEIWVGLQKNVLQIFEKSPAWAKHEILPELDARILSENSALTKLGLIEVRNFVSQQIAMNFNTQGFLEILSSPNGLYHEADLTKANLARALSRVIIRSYAKDLLRVNTLGGVLLPEIQVAYDQFKPLAVDLEIVEPSNSSFVSSRFLESNLFLAVSDGNNIADFSELQNLVLHLLSGVERAAEIKKDFFPLCLLSGNQIITSRTVVSEDCILDKYALNEKAFSGLPQFLGMRTEFTASELRDYYLNLLKAAGHIPNDKKTVVLSYADLFPHVVQYIEMVFSRHDTNRDNRLQKDEALAAFPVFKDLLKDLVKAYKQIKEEDLPGVFVYILKFGRPPKKTNIGELLQFVAFIKDKDQKQWDINSSRLDLGKIFNYISESTKPMPPAVASGDSSVATSSDASMAAADTHKP